MHASGAANPVELAMMRRALDDHCLEFGIEGESLVRESLASRILFLFASGISTLDELKNALRQDRSA